MIGFSEKLEKQIQKLFLLNLPNTKKEIQVKEFWRTWSTLVTCKIFEEIFQEAYQFDNWTDFLKIEQIKDLKLLILKHLELFPLKKQQVQELKKKVEIIDRWKTFRDVLEEIVQEWPLAKNISSWREFPDASFLAQMKWANKHVCKERRKRFLELANLFEFGTHEENNFLLTPQQETELYYKGFVVLEDFFEDQTLDVAIESINNVIKAEEISEFSYQDLSGPRSTLGIVTKYGWTKFYTSLAHRLICIHPKLMSLNFEIFQTNKLTLHPYDLKLEFPRPAEHQKNAFIHTDLNYSQMLLFKTLGIPIYFFQLIAPLTPMTEKAGVSFFPGWHQLFKWERPLLQAIREDRWNIWGSRTSDLSRICSEMTTEQKICFAKKNDLVIFCTTMPHASLINKSSLPRLAIYPYLSPILEETQDDYLYSLFPSDSKEELWNVFKNGKAPRFVGHPLVESRPRHNASVFCQALPHIPLPDNEIENALLGRKPWTQNLYKKLTSKTDAPKLWKELESYYIDEMKKRVLEEKECIFKHRNNSSKECAICQRTCEVRSNPNDWWHSTEAALHLNSGCNCNLCDRVKGWVHFSQGHCSCEKCN